MESANTWSDIARDQTLPSVYVILEHQRNVTRWQETNYLNYVLNRKTHYVTFSATTSRVFSTCLLRTQFEPKTRAISRVLCRCVLLINSYTFEACHVNPVWCFETSVLHDNDQTVLPTPFE